MKSGFSLASGIRSWPSRIRARAPSFDKSRMRLKVVQNVFRGNLARRWVLRWETAAGESHPVSRSY